MKRHRGLLLRAQPLLALRVDATAEGKNTRIIWVASCNASAKVDDRAAAR